MIKINNLCKNAVFIIFFIFLSRQTHYLQKTHLIYSIRHYFYQKNKINVYTRAYTLYLHSCKPDLMHTIKVLSVYLSSLNHLIFYLNTGPGDKPAIIH